MVLWVENLLERLRYALLGDLREAVGALQRDVRRLQCDVEQQQAALRDPATLKPLVSAALRDELCSPPDELAAALLPLVERLVQASMPPPAIVAAASPRRWRLPAAAALLAALMIPRVTGVSEATVDPVPVVAAVHPSPVILQERSDGFGLGEAAMSDDELAGLVRTRLATCADLRDAHISYSVKDGWVWLRGAASAAGRKAAEQALRDLEPGVFVVNQLAVASSEKAVAER